MFPHEEDLVRAIKCCKITKLVQDLGALYVDCTNVGATDEEFLIAMKVERILMSAAKEISELGPKPQIK